MICSIGDVFGGCTRFCVFSRVFIFLRIFAEFSRKFARKVHEEPHRFGLRFFFYTIAKVFRRFQVARDSFSLLKPRKLRSRLSKFRIFALVVFVSFCGIQSNHALRRGHLWKRSYEENAFRALKMAGFSYVAFVSFSETQSNFALQIAFAHMRASINAPS